MSDLHNLQAFYAVLQREDAPGQISEHFTEFFATYGLSQQELSALSHTGKMPLLMYRTMVHSRLRKVIADWIPRTIARLGQKLFAQEFIQFMATEAPKTPYLRQVPAEFVAWAVPRWQENSNIPAYLGDLARHELLSSDVYNLPKGGEPETGQPMALDQPLRVDGSVSMLRYDYAVHLLPSSYEDRSEPIQQVVYLLAYRDREQYKVRYLELTQRAAAVMQQLQLGKSVEAALKDACQILGESLDDEFLASMAHFFTDLGQRGILLGAEV